ncbi:hypothetical protein ACFL35_00835 [Candidatus Riflebacteria bacterium]
MYGLRVFFISCCFSLSLFNNCFAAETPGKYIGFRGDSKNTTSGIQKEYQENKKKHFDLLQSGAVEEAKTFFKNKVAPLKKQLQNMEGDGSFVDTTDLTYTMRYRFNFHIYFEKKSKKEGKKGDSPIIYDYLRLFTRLSFPLRLLWSFSFRCYHPA